MMTENERRASPKNRWIRWYMWLAYGGGVLGVIAAVVVIMAMAPAPSSDGKTVPSHHNMATLSTHDVAALIRQHPSISGPAELNDLQFIANQDGITLDESIARYAWGDDFSMMATAIEDDDPVSVVEAGSTSRVLAWIKFRVQSPATPGRPSTNSSPKTLTLQSAYKPAKTRGSPSRRPMKR